MPRFINRSGESKLANNGQRMTIIRYGNSNDIDVKFEDGTIVTKKHYSSFLSGKIANPNFKISHVGETSVAYNGMKMTVVEYTTYDNIVVEFEDGYRKKCSYGCFLNGVVKNPNASCFSAKFKRTRDKYIGMEIQTTASGVCTVVDYKGSKEVTVEFEDGTRVTCDVSSIKNGQIKNPNIEGSSRLLSNQKLRVGVESVNALGYRAKVVEYNNAHNFVVEYEDGTRSTVHSFTAFLDGRFKKPIGTRVGEKRVMSNGMLAEVIEYISDDNITVKFEDGYIRDNIHWANFVRGTVAHKPREFNGQVVRQNNGLLAEITSSTSSLHIDVTFEDGTIVKDRQYSSFLRGGIGHPTINRGSGRIKDFTLLGKVMVYDDNTTFYKCRCGKCNFEDILTPSEMITHTCVSQ